MSDELRKLAAARMASEPPGHTFLATTLVHPKQPLSTASPTAERRENMSARQAVPLLHRDGFV